jgi:hypothetical protein
MVVNQFEVMVEQAEREPVVFALGLHAYVLGSRFGCRHSAKRCDITCLSATSTGFGSCVPARLRGTVRLCLPGSFRKPDERAHGSCGLVSFTVTWTPADLRRA